MDVSHSKKTLKLTTVNVETEIYKNQENVLSGKQFLLLIPLTRFYCETYNIEKLKNILDGKSKLSLRVVDWFVTNYSKKNLVMYNLKKLKEKYRLSDEKENDIESDADSGIDIDTTEYYGDYFNVFSDYRSQLKSLNKKNFDPFCRRERIKFFYGKKDADYIITTVGQLNFFKWCIENYILEHIEENIKEIEKDMNYYTYNKLTDEKTKKKPQDTDCVKQKNNKQKNNKQKKNNNNNNNKKISDKTITTEITGTTGITRSNCNNIEKQTKKNKDNLLEETISTSKKNTRRKRKELSVSATKSFVIHNLKSVITFD
jgi:hypothetical protein